MHATRLKVQARMGLASSVLIGFLLLTAGCSWFQGKDQYLQARPAEPLKVPPELASDGEAQPLGELFPVPPLTQEDISFAEDTERFRVPRPETLTLGALRESVKIQKLGDERWILVNVDPGELWPHVRNFLVQNDLSVAGSDTERGLMEPAWLAFKNDTDRIDRYRIRIDKGVQPDSSEIHVLHMSLDRDAATTEDLNSWPEESTDPERETWMVDELANSLATADISAGGVSLLGSDIGGDTKVKLARRNDEPVLRFELNRIRVLATLTHAAEQEGFTRYDSDANAGLFYLGYEQPRESAPGWLGRLFGAEKNPEPKPSPYSLSDLQRVLPDDGLANSSEAEVARNKLPNAPGFLLVIKEVAPEVWEAHLRNAYGERISPRQARELLSVLRRNLI